LPPPLFPVIPLAKIVTPENCAPSIGPLTRSKLYRQSLSSGWRRQAEISLTGNRLARLLNQANLLKVSIGGIISTAG